MPYGLEGHQTLLDPSLSAGRSGLAFPDEHNSAARGRVYSERTDGGSLTRHMLFRLLQLA